MGVHRTKSFKSGNGVALRLPGGFAPGEKLLVEQQGHRLTVVRLAHRAEVAGKLRGLLPVLESIGRR